MPKVKKNGKLFKQKPKPKPERKDNIKSSTTKSKSVNQHQNVNVNVSIVKNKSGGKEAKGETKADFGGGSGGVSQVKKPPQPPQNIYYQQPSNNNSELTTLLKDMSKELYSQRNIQASNQPALVNPNPFGIPKPNVALPKPNIPAYVGGNNVFEDDPFEDVFNIFGSNDDPFKDLSSMTDSIFNSNSGKNLLVPAKLKDNILSDLPNPYVNKPLIEGQKYEMPFSIDYEEQSVPSIHKPIISWQQYEMPYTAEYEDEELGNELGTVQPFILRNISELRKAKKIPLVEAALYVKLEDERGNIYSRESLGLLKNTELVEMLRPYIK